MPLNTDQKRYIAAALTELEEHLLRFERLIQKDETVTIFRKIPNPFPLKQRSKLFELIAAVKEQLKAMQDAFDLPTEVSDLHWQLTVTLLHIATTLEECQSRRIKNFGELDSDTARRLDSHLQKLSTLIATIVQEAKINNR